MGVGRGRDAVKNVFLLGFVCLNIDHQELSPKVQLLSLVALPPHIAATVLWISEAGWSESVLTASVSHSRPICKCYI